MTRMEHCPGGNATDPIWWVLASSDGISSWTPLKPQQCNPNPNLNLWPINSGLVTSLLLPHLPHLSYSLTDRVYSNSYCSCSFEAEIIRISQSSHKMYSNNILNFQECKKKSLETYWRHHVYIYIYIYIYISQKLALNSPKRLICPKIPINQLIKIVENFYLARQVHFVRQ